MDITLLIIIGAVGFVALLLIAGVVGWFFMRRRGNEAVEGDSRAALEEKKPAETGKAPSPAAQPIQAQDNGTAKAAKSSPARSKPTPPVPAAPPAMPIAQMEQPEETGEKIRILIVDDNVGTRENVGRLLYFEQDMEVIGQAINGQQGIDMAEDLKPHIVLMDINMPDMDGITATEKMSVKTPYSQVIIMSVQAERDYMKRAMAAGARDFQPKPFTADELISCIRRVYQIGLPVYRQLEALEKGGGGQATVTQSKTQEPEAVRSGGSVIGIYSAKGGIGTSSLAVNLATALQQLQGDVALIDTDLQFGDVSVHLNIQPSRTMVDSIHDGQIDAELLPELLLAHNSGLKVLLAPTQPEVAESVTPPMLATMIRELKKKFSLVIVDMEKQLNERALTVLDNVDYLLLVTGPELPAIKNAKLFLDLTSQLEIPADRIDIVMNHATISGGVPASKIEKALQISHSYPIPHDPRMQTATNKGVTVIQQDSGSPAAKAIMSLARSMAQKVSAGDESPVKEAV